MVFRGWYFKIKCIVQPAVRIGDVKVELWNT